MKKLYIIRHAKSDWSLGQKDIDRVLNKRGEKQSIALGDYFTSKNVFPDLIISSIAERTQITAKNIANEIDYPFDKIKLESNIYEAHYEQLLHTIWEISNNIDTVFFVGHNPGVSDLAYFLTDKYLDFKTSCVAVVEFNEIQKWEEIESYSGNLIDFITPE